MNEATDIAAMLAAVAVLVRYCTAALHQAGLSGMDSAMSDA